MELIIPLIAFALGAAVGYGIRERKSRIRRHRARERLGDPGFSHSDN
jgi:hypothetical protein